MTWILLAVILILLLATGLLWRNVTRMTRERLVQSAWYLDDDDHWTFGVPPR